MKELQTKAIEAAKRYLEYQGLDVIDSEWAREGLAGRLDIVAEDAGTLVFATVSASALETDAGFREEPLSREQFELLATSWLAEHPEAEVDVPVRFDRISLMAFGGNRAMIRHYVNAIGADAVLV